MVALDSISLLIFAAVLAWSANAIVQATSYISKRLQIRSFLMGFLVLGFATTVPEMFVAYQAISDGIPQLAIGNLLGGSILLLTLVMGGSAMLLKRIILDHGMTKQDIFLSAVVIGLPAIFFWDGALTRIEGMLLIFSYVVHIMVINREQHVVNSIESHAKRLKHPLHALLLIVAGFVGLAVSSKNIVLIAQRLADSLSISPFVIGLFLITLGTNLPELTLAAGAILQKKRDIAFGDVLGSAVINTPILGCIALIAPFSISRDVRMYTTLLLLAGSAGFFWWAASSKRDITRKEGGILLLVYVSFVIIEFIGL